jgi:hypothetical protein
VTTEDKMKNENESLKRQLSFFKEVEKTMKKAQDMNLKRITSKKVSEDLTRDKKVIIATQGENLNIIKAIKKRNCTSCNCHSSVDKTPSSTSNNVTANPETVRKYNPNFTKKIEKITATIQKDLRTSVSPFIKKKIATTAETSKSTNLTPTVVFIDIIFRI